MDGHRVARMGGLQRPFCDRMGVPRGVGRKRRFKGYLRGRSGCLHRLQGLRTVRGTKGRQFAWSWPRLQKFIFQRFWCDLNLITAGIFPAPWGVPRKASVSEPYGIPVPGYSAPWGGEVHWFLARVMIINGYFLGCRLTTPASSDAKY